MILSQLINLISLTIFSYFDVKTKSVPAVILYSLTGISVVCAVIFLLINHDITALLITHRIITAIILGVLSFILSYTTKQKALGYADVAALFLCGLGLGAGGSLIALLVSFASAGITFLVMQRIAPKKALPFLPFLTLGYLFSFILGEAILRTITGWL